MNCPSCNTVLMMAERQGVEIDYCPACRGVWLDRGELDKLMSLTTQAQELRREYRSRDLHDDDDDDDHRLPPHRERDVPDRYYPKKRESFWSNLFDFD